MEIILLLIIIGLLVFIAYKVNSIVLYLTKEAKTYVEVDDDDYEKAKDYVTETGKASTTSLQTAFRWGYNKAARILGQMEEDEIIGPAVPNEKYRKILFKEK